MFKVKRRVSEPNVPTLLTSLTFLTSFTCNTESGYLTPGGSGVSRSVGVSK